MNSQESNKVSLSRDVIEYAFGELFHLGANSQVTEQRMADLKASFGANRSEIAVRKLRAAVRAYFKADKQQLRKYLKERRATDSVYLTMMLCITLPEIASVALGYFKNAKSRYSSREMADILNMDTYWVSQTINDARKKKKDSIVFNAGHRSIRLEASNSLDSNRNEWSLSVLSKTNLEQERVETIIILYPDGVQDEKVLLRNSVILPFVNLSQSWKAKLLPIKSKSRCILDVVVIRKAGQWHSRYFVDDPSCETIVVVFSDKLLGSPDNLT